MFGCRSDTWTVDMGYLLYFVLFLMSCHAPLVRHISAAPSANLKFDLSSSSSSSDHVFNVSFARARTSGQLRPERLDTGYANSDRSPSLLRPADDPSRYVGQLPLPQPQPLLGQRDHNSHLTLARSHQDVYEMLWKSADVPMETSSATKIDVLGFLLKREVEKLRDVSNGQVELVFLVDSSASVGIVNFFNELKFVKKLLADFTVAPDATRVAIVTFSSKHRVELNVNQLDDSPNAPGYGGRLHHKCALLNEDLPRITYVGGGTYTKGAFELAKKVLQSARPNSTRAVFLLTDGLSNGPNPTPVAASLKADGVEVFTFGIRDGYIPELLTMASDPKDEHCYILDSFAEFEALARRALHEDLRVGEFIEESPEKCSSRCLWENDCCDSAATCRCGTHTGAYDCVCPAGFYGSGLKGKCLSCPIGSYKRQALPGGISTCLPCPDPNHVSPVNSTTPDMCVCKDGFRWDPVFQRCKVIFCPPLKRPENGSFVECSNVVHGACAVRCNRGHELVGSSIRLCLPNGTWSGENFICRVKKCSVMTAPQNGSLQCTTDNFAYGTACTAACNQGFKLVGSPSRRCLSIAHWDGLPVSCRAIRCPLLPPIPHGTMVPSRCNTERQEYGSVCKISCDEGFDRRGPKRKECTANGSWNNQFDPTQACSDFTPPELECPPPITTETAPQSDRVDVEWNVPRPWDNSGETPLMRAIPNVHSPWTFPLGQWNITYTAMDQSGNMARCVFSVIVIDREPPSIKRCRSPPTTITSLQQLRVTWEEPEFTDNSQGAVTISRSHRPGDKFALGVTHVEYLAADAAGNTRSCIISVDVQQTLCHKPRDPVGGTAVCLHTNQGMNCSVTCGPGYAMSTRPGRHYFCARNGTWYPDGKVPWDDCSETHHANTVLQPMTFLYETSDCDSAFARKVERILTTGLDEPIRDYCGDQVSCELASVKAKCDTKDPMPFIRGSISTVQRGSGGSQLRQALAAGPEVRLSADRLTNLASPNLFVDIIVSARSSDNATAERNNEQYEVVRDAAKSLPDQIQTNLINGTVEGGVNSSGEEGDQEERIVRVSGISVMREELQPVCAHGSVLSGQGEEAQCVKCIPGTYFNVSTVTCEYCPVGFYQGDTGQTECVPCPVGTLTETSKSTSMNDCKELCSPGSHSPTGLELCELCPRQTYQSSVGGTSCIRCRPGLRTSGPGARHHSECQARCRRGHASATGLMPCLPCPAGTFTMMPWGSTYCLRCPGSYPISQPGSTAITSCRNAENEGHPGQSRMSINKVPFSECFSAPCRNGASCLSSSGGYTCSCTPGYSGVHCDVEINECGTGLCLNDGTCVDLVDDFECVCAQGFSGRHCSEDWDECLSQPCHNEGTCIDGPNSYECVCASGYTGVNCEEQINYCEAAPCYNHGICEDLIGSFICACLPGYYGELCESEVDECLSNPCQNGATCLDMPNEYSCSCVLGFTGDRCERDIDECLVDPCLNGGTCVDLINGFQCSCLPGFSGTVCENELSWDFNLVFNRSGIEDYIWLNRDLLDLTAVSIAFWMRTDNTTNYGTVFSYAINDSSANTLTLTDYTGFVLAVNEQDIVSDITTNDGRWHHIAVTWESGSGEYKMFKDGSLQASGTGLAKGSTIPGGGKLIVGQEQDTLGGGFHPFESYVGELYLLTLWDRVLSPDEILELSRSCETPGDVIVAWPDFLAGMEGEVVRINNSFCQGCKRPKAENGLVKGYQPSSPLTSVTFHCDPGFELPRHEVSSAECQVSGEWIPGHQAHCERVHCDSPTHVQNGYVARGNYFYFGDGVFYSCRTNFTLIGPTYRECSADGRWSDNKPECQYVTCGEPPYVAHSFALSQVTGQPIQSVFPGHNATYQCLRGYAMHGEPSVTCQPSGQWTTPPICRIISCPTLSSSKNPILVTSNGSVFSSIAEYLCIPGFKMKGAGILQCQDSGKWDAPVPTCSIIECGPAPEIPSGSVTSDGQTYGSSAWYSCDEGYEADRTVVHCGSSGAWEPFTPTCSHIRCAEPAQVASGKTIGSDFTYNSTVHFECDRGHVLIGKETLVCGSDQLWSGDLPVCQPVSCGLPLLFGEYINTSINPGTALTYGESVEYQCLEGYLFGDGGSHELTCGADGTWEGNLSRCIPISCGSPKPIPNAVVLGEDYTYNQTVHSQCKRGYVMSGDPVRRCLATGEWTNSSARCELVTCGPPPRVDHANVSEDMNYNDTASYTCHKGYILSGPQGQDGYMLNGSEGHSGFVLNGSLGLVCNETGNWEGPLPSCEPISCGPPVSPENGNISIGNHTFASIADIICLKGYHLVGHSHVQCQSDGTWTNSSAECVPISCGQPKQIQNGRILGSLFAFGNSVEYRCNEGYTIEGAPGVNCTYTGEWTPSPPTCQPVDCGSPPGLDNALVIGDSFTFNNTIFIICEEGYALNRSVVDFRDQYIMNMSGDIFEGPSMNTVDSQEGIATNKSKALEYDVDPLKESVDFWDAYAVNNSAIFEEMVCQADGRWSKKRVECLPVRCGMPSTINNGTTVGSSFSYLDSVHYSCDPGFVLNGPPKRVCTANGTWNGTPPTCDLLDCGKPPNISNTNVTISGATYGSSATYDCSPGFEARLSAMLLTCDSNGDWNGSISNSSCQPVNCPDDPKIPNGLLNAEGPFRYGDTAVISCTVGYRLNMNETLQCSVDSTWIPKNISCEAISCPQTQAPINGTIVAESRMYGETTVFACDAGYRLEGNTTILCSGDGEWEGTVPRCLPVLCEPLLPPLNGSVRTQGSLVWNGSPSDGSVSTQRYSPGSRADFSCNDGFNMEGSDVTRCSEEGTWTHLPPVCSLVECPSPLNPFHGVAIFFSSHYQDEVAFQCEPGYRLEGDGLQTCLANGSWSGGVPHCRLIECWVAGTIIHGSVTHNGTVLLGEQITFSCNHGYALHGVPVLTCTSDGLWDRKEPSCQPVSCGHPPRLENSVVTFSGTAFRSQATYRCSEGFTLEGDPQRECLASGNWSEAVQRCVPILCPALVPPANAVLSVTNVSMNGVATYSCERGYILGGPDTRTCNQSGVWTGTEPECQPITCQPPKDIVGGQIISLGNMKLNSHIHYQCDLGYKIQGEVLRICQTDGRWSGDAPTCRPVSCDQPPVVTNGICSFKATTFNSSAIYDCHKGYLLLGESVLRCSNDGVWHPPAPTCHPVKCPALFDPSGGQVTYQHRVYGSEALYLCGNAFEIVGPRRRTCLANGTWSESEPLCISLVCKHLPRVPHAIYPANKTKFYAGDVVQLGCEPGYAPTSDGIAECIRDNTWSMSSFECLAVECPKPISPKNGRAEYIALTFGAQVTYTCHSDYTAIGHMMATCRSNSQWSNPAPQCVEQTCPEITPQDQLVLSGSSNAVGDIIMVSCSAGFKLMGASRLVCTSSSAWNHPLPRCVADGCGEPPPLDNGMMYGSSFLPGDIVSFRCSRGFYLSGSSSMRCLPHNNWSNALPSCVAFDSRAALQSRPVCVLPCLHGGRCVGPYKCECPYGFAGARCEQVLCTRRCVGASRCAGRHEQCR